VASPDERREALKALFHEARGCTRCPQLAQTRHTVVFGAGNANADLMFVGEAPGRNEDEQGLPFVGQAGRLLDSLLGEIGLRRDQVFVANVLKCLKYDAMVQLGDGSWERIGRLVRSRYSGTVMCVDDDGRLVARQVTGWHATPLGDRRVHRLSFRSAKVNGATKAATCLTGDHPVLTERGFVNAGDLRAGDRVATGQGLSAVVKDVVCGTLLGDGSIRRNQASLTFGHSAKQAAYARFKAALLEGLGVRVEERRVAAVAGGQAGYDVIHVRTHAHRALGTLRREFYGDRKGVPAWLADGLTPRMLAFWFMDDGYLRVRGGGRQPLAEIATNAFSDADLQTLLEGLRRLGLPAKASRGRLFFDVPTSRVLSELIARFVPEAMRYKLHPEVAESVAFDPGAFEDDGVAQVLYDEVEIEDVTDRQGNDRTFFCIDVEEHHNFVTAGGVVHNCRPPGNRDPHPVEIERCQEYLFQQIELIEPTVICTLGNFATKLLRNDTTGIMRLHGRPEVRVVGPRAVRLFPVFHPAAALYTPSNVEVLRKDFAALPELLALGAPPQPPPLVEPGPEDLPVEPAVEALVEVPAGAPAPGEASAEAPAVAESLGAAADSRAEAESLAAAGDEPRAADADAEPEPTGVQLGLF
jgi:uracil-DNA glycosylase family 4